MNKRLRPEDLSEILVKKGYEKVPLLVSGRGTPRDDAVAWNHRDRDDEFIVVPLDEFGFLDNDAVEDVLSKL